MSQIHFIGGEKGGVGKSLVARLLAQYFIDRSLPFLAFDTDRSHPALMRFYAGYTSPVVIDQAKSLDSIVEAALADPERRVLVDLAAQTQQPLESWIEDSGLLELAKELGITLTYWHVMDAGRDSVDLLSKLLDRFGDRIRLLLVLNEVRGDHFDLLKASGQLERAQALGAATVSLRKLAESTVHAIDAHSASFWAAVNASERAVTGLGLLERQRVKVWLQRVYTELDRVQP
jgi:hypothetical protein